MRLTLSQIMKIVVGFALASACIVPLARGSEVGVIPWPVTFVVGAIVTPLAFALATMLLARRDSLRTCQVWAYCLAASAVALGIAIYAFGNAISVWANNGTPLRGRLVDDAARAALLSALAAIPFAALLRGTLRSWLATSRQGPTVDVPK